MPLSPIMYKLSCLGECKPSKLAGRKESGHHFLAHVERYTLVICILFEKKITWKIETKIKTTKNIYLQKYAFR